MKTKKSIKTIICSFIAIYWIFSVMYCQAQTPGTAISTTGVAPNPSALLDVNCTQAPYQGVLVPRLSTTHMNMINTPATGLLIYNTDCNTFYYYNGVAWVSMTSIAAGVSINASPGGAICTGTNVTYTATPINGGSSPAYQWKVNGSNVGTNSATYAFAPANADVISCMMTSNAACVTGSPATASITATVVPGPTASAGGTATICNGSSTTLTASGGGTYLWSNSATTAAITVSPSSTTNFTVSVTLSGCTSTASATVTVVAAPSTANAGSDQLNVAGTSATLAGNSPGTGSGLWSILSGTGGNITTPVSPSSGFTGTSGNSYVLTWTISNAPCTASSDNVTISFASAACGGLSTVSDVDGNSYNTIAIGTQCWMKENLKTTKYKNSVAIPNVTVGTTWAALSTGAYCDQNNTPSNSNTYGRLYNWYAVGNSNGLCPNGWHAPNDAEWCTLENAVEPGSDALCNISGATPRGTYVAQSLRATSWASGTNASGFTALPGGDRYLDNGNAYYNGMGTWAGFWTATTNDYQNYVSQTCWDDDLQDYVDCSYWQTIPAAWYRYFASGNGSYRDNIYGKAQGFSVRCVKD